MTIFSAFSGIGKSYGPENSYHPPLNFISCHGAEQEWHLILFWQTELDKESP